jgi:hypothetical protein
MIEKINTCGVTLEVEFKLYEEDSSTGVPDSISITSIKIGDIEMYEFFNTYNVLNKIYAEVWNKISWT